MIYCKTLDKSYATKDEMFADLLKNEEAIISVKKSAEHKSIEKGMPRVDFLDESKAEAISEKAGFKVEEGYIYPVISTTRYLDSHKDVHFDGCFKRTVREQQGKVFYITDHKLEFSNIIAYPKDVKMFIAELPWQWVGKDYEGNTEALVFKIKKDAIQRDDVKKAIEEKMADFENSIRMRYVTVKLAINSKDKDYAVQKAYWDATIDQVANRKEAEEDGFYWGVEELGIYKEGSLVIAGGSNDATSIIQSGDAITDNKNKSDENPNDTVQLVEQQATAEAKAKKDELIKVLTQMHY